MFSRVMAFTFSGYESLIREEAITISKYTRILFIKTPVELPPHTYRLVRRGSNTFDSLLHLLVGLQKETLEIVTMGENMLATITQAYKKNKIEKIISNMKRYFYG